MMKIIKLRIRNSDNEIRLLSLDTGMYEGTEKVISSAGKGST